MSKEQPVLSPILLRFSQLDLEQEFRALEVDQFSVHLFTIIVILTAMNLTRIILYSVVNSDAAELGWAVSLLVLSLCLRCLLWLRALKIPTVIAAEVFVYLTCVEWIVSFPSFFSFEVRALIVTLGMANVYSGMFLFAWNWPLYFLGTALGTVYLLLRTNLYFEEQDVPAQICTALLPALIVYLHVRKARETYSQLKSSASSSSKWESLLTIHPSHIVLLNLQTTLYINASASEFLHQRNPQAVHTVLKSCTRRDNPSQRFEDILRDLLSSAHSSDALSESIFILVREDGSQQSLQFSYRVVAWEGKSKAVAVTFANITRVLNAQLQEGKSEVTALLSACARDMIRPGLIRTSGELLLKKRGAAADPEQQLASAFHGLYCLEDLQRVFSGSDLKLNFKFVSLQREMQRFASSHAAFLATRRLRLDYEILEVPDTIKLDQTRFRQFLSLLFQAAIPSALPDSKVSLTVSSKAGLISNELLLSMTWTGDSNKQTSALFAVAEKLAQKIGTEGLKREESRVVCSFFAGFASQG